MGEFNNVIKYANNVAKEIQGYFNSCYCNSLSNIDIQILRKRFNMSDICMKDNLIECRGKQTTIFYQIVISNKNNTLEYKVTAKFIGIDKPKLLDY